MKNRKNMLWRLCCAGVIGLSILCFTPLVIPAGQYQPVLLGLPRSLWAGMLIAFAILALAVTGTFVHPDMDDVNANQDKRP